MHRRILILTPRDAQARAVQAALETRHSVHICTGVAQFLAALGQGAAAAVVAEEALAEPDLAGPLAAWIGGQPAWSDFPFIVFGAEPSPGVALPGALAWLGNAVLLERPIAPESRTVMQAADAAVRARLRQYAARDREAVPGPGGRFEAVGRLTGDIAHEFNNLLHVVKMNLELVSMYATEEKVKPVVERAKTAARRGGKLTSQLLAFARAQSQALPTPQQRPRVGEVLTNMKELLEISAGPGVAVEFDLADGLPPVLDAGALELAALNLASHARETLGQGGRLKFCTRATQCGAAGDPARAGDATLLTVTGEGEGNTGFRNAVFEFAAAPAA